MDYKTSGVDIEAGYESVKLIKKYVEQTMRPEVLGGIGGFSGAFSMAKIKEMEDPVLLSGTDGVGTKLKLAFEMDKHDTIGIDAVAMCVNDVACAGGESLFFLDYIACGKNVPEKIAAIVKGVADGCRQAECALIGGETAEHPGLMPEDEYDVAGFAVGAVDRKDMITGAKVFGIDENGAVLSEYHPELGQTLGECLLTPTKIYVKMLKKIKADGVTVKGCSHITGGGFYENMPRMLPEGTAIEVQKDSYEVPPIFRLIQKTGNIDEHVMYNTFNMGIGMCLAVDPSDADRVLSSIADAGEKGFVIGRVTEGNKEVTIL